MARKKTSPGHEKHAAPRPAPAALSPHSAEAAFESIKAQLDALARDAVRQPNFNLQEGALVALGVHGRLAAPEKRAVVEALAKAGTVNPALVVDLGTVARAAWFVRHKLELAEAVHSDASLPAKLVADATETRKRMLKVLEYHLDEDGQAASLLASIRAGSGYMDLANDLIALAGMYEDHKEAISKDQKRYRAGDRKLARELADEILSALGGPGTPDAERWRNYQARVFTLLAKHYEESIRVGRFLLWYEGGEELFPSLFAAVRSRPAKRPAAEGESAPAGPVGEAKPD